MSTQPLEGHPKHYFGIIVVIAVSFLLCTSAIITLNIPAVEEWLTTNFGQRKSFVIQLFFWAALGATLTSYKYCAEDKEINEVESAKPAPDPANLRWPSNYDVAFYALRILFSGVQGVLGAMILFAGLGFFDASLEKWEMKQNLFVIIFCVLIGIYQNDFLAFLSGIKKKLFEGK